MIVSDTFNKSACLDLESRLIELFSGDGRYTVLNRNIGITDADYYDRVAYTAQFEGVFDQLRAEGLFRRSVTEIENDELFKLSPFKALTRDQEVAVEGVLEALVQDLRAGTTSTTVIQGEPGTGKTIVAIYLLKLIADIRRLEPDDVIDSDSLLADYFLGENRGALEGLRTAFVVPQQSLRGSVAKVFDRTPGLQDVAVLTPFQVGESAEPFDLIVVDEAHRLNQRANQPSGVLNGKFRDITIRLFGSDDTTKTQLDWIRARSAHQILMLDPAQTVRPADLPSTMVGALVDEARRSDRLFPLMSQMRVRAGSDYVGHIRRLLGATRSTGPEHPLTAASLGDYEFLLFDDVASMHAAIRERDREHGLARMIAGYAWKWRSRKDATAYDIEIGDYRARWNSRPRDWIASAGALEEIGSIHTVQGYDLNYAGVIIGPDLRFDPEKRRLFMDRSSYFDAKGQENNAIRDITYTDEDLRLLISNIYAVLMTRGMLGTFVHVVDPPLREHLSRFIPAADPR
ncbi:DNA/RNA helicase domain-containing protein [Clavibacter capsici]|uniref:DNA/RNA helicase domain-containing protein n=1 Tax=Clavibacter capsici TaxID=1874630 RepID=UPI00293F0C4B|nr:DNA/RNA helicase domain-containing protein [Clavibacter capsici]